jgi:IS30 family transposase
VAYLREVQREFWRSVRASGVISVAAQRAGVNELTAARWFDKAGGMPPMSLAVPGSKSRGLSIAEREQIRIGMDRRETYSQIGDRIGRGPGTVWKEIDLNQPQRYSSATDHRRGGPGRPVKEWGYSPHRAQLRAEREAARPKVAKLAANDRLRGEVQDRLEEEHAPQQIAARLRHDFPEEPEMWVSHETIYQSLFVQGRGALRRDLASRLRSGRVKRRPRRKIGQRGGSPIPGMVNISERPAEVEDRAVPGHWEGDLIMGSLASNSAIGTLVERATRFTMLLHLPDGRGADAVQAAMLEAMARLPQTLRKTLTWDQGREMTNHAAIAEATHLAIYFCDPHSPWQRGSNENTNGLLRQYFPKGTDLSIYQADYLEHVARKLNNRPRETLGWKTPAEALDELLSNPQNPNGVSMTG